ncbi:MAG: single-stranded DNA-binding protein [Methanoregulaceae archaeon]|jgi:single-strand DNA-binding protein
MAEVVSHYKNQRRTLMVNRVYLIGRLGADPEVRYTPDSTMVVNFRIATDESYKNRSGEKVSKTEWHRIVVWGKLAEICGNYLGKGALVFIEGKLQTRTWDDKEGNKRSVTEILASGMKMLESRRSQGGDDSRDPEPLPDDDVPF